MSIPQTSLPIYLQKYSVTIRNPVDESIFTPSSYSSVGLLPSNEEGSRIWEFQLTGTLPPNKNTNSKKYQFTYNFNNVDYDKNKIRFDGGLSGVATICGNVLDASEIFSFEYSTATGVFRLELDSFQLGFVIKNPTPISYTLFIKQGTIAPNDTPVDIPIAAVVPVISYGIGASYSDPPSTYLWAVTDNVKVDIVTGETACSIDAKTEPALNTTCKYNDTTKPPCLVGDLLGISDYFKVSIDGNQLTYDLPNMRNLVPYAASDSGDTSKSTTFVKTTFDDLYNFTTKDITGVPRHSHVYWQANVDKFECGQTNREFTYIQTCLDGKNFKTFTNTKSTILGTTVDPDPGIDNLQDTMYTEDLTPEQNPSNDQTKQSYLPPFYGLPYVVRFCDCVEPCPSEGDFGKPIPIFFESRRLYLSFIPTSSSFTVPEGWQDITVDLQDSYFCQTGDQTDFVTTIPPGRGENYSILITGEQMQPHVHMFEFYGTVNYKWAYTGCAKKDNPLALAMPIYKNVEKNPRIKAVDTAVTGEDYIVGFSAPNGKKCVILQNAKSMLLNCHVGMILFCDKEITDNPNLLPLTRDYSKSDTFPRDSIIGKLVLPSDLPNFKATGGYIMGLDLPTKTVDEEAIANASWIRQYIAKVKGDKYKDWFQTTDSLSEVYVKVDQDHQHESIKFNILRDVGQTGGTNPGVPSMINQNDGMYIHSKKTISQGSGKPVNILPSSIRGLIAHLVVDAAVVVDPS